ncbi:MAG: chorismate synthase [Gaiellales bacterium]|nr:chorismate synthase [Gaiellales bacterium]
MSCITSGESHGPAEVCIIEGVPAGLRLAAEGIDLQLHRRQTGYGRGGRMAIESDHVEILSGVRGGSTLGTPVTLLVKNADHRNWIPAMQAAPWATGEGGSGPSVTVPRPGHADYAGLCKHDHHDIRNVLERASARETVSRVAGGAVARALLRELGVEVRGRVIAVGGVEDATVVDLNDPQSINWAAVEASALRVADAGAELAIIAQIDAAREAGESLGGTLEVWAWGLVPGLGGYATRQMRLDGRLLGSVGSVPAIVGVELGLGFKRAGLRGSAAQDAFYVSGTERPVVQRRSNRAGGVEGGMTNGSPLVLRAAMKPIPTMTSPLPSVDLQDMTAAPAHKERSDIVAVPAATVVAEAEVCLVLASAYVEKFGGDCLGDLQEALRLYCARLEARGLWRRS